MKLENEDTKNDFERRKNQFQNELSDACFKEEKARTEVQKWEATYKEWMSAMESRVNNLMHTNEFLQVCFVFVWVSVRDSIYRNVELEKI